MAEEGVRRGSTRGMCADWAGGLLRALRTVAPSLQPLCLQPRQEPWEKRSCCFQRRSRLAQLRWPVVQGYPERHTTSYTLALPSPVASGSVPSSLSSSLHIQPLRSPHYPASLASSLGDRAFRHRCLLAPTTTPVASAPLPHTQAAAATP